MINLEGLKEWLVSTPRHVALYEAFGWQMPLFAHVGLLVNEERQKLSKRHGDVDIASWRDRGILPSTLLNYVMLLGWSMGKGVKGQQEVMDLNDMVKRVSGTASFGRDKLLFKLGP